MKLKQEDYQSSDKLPVSNVRRAGNFEYCILDAKWLDKEAQPFTIYQYSRKNAPYYPSYFSIFLSAQLDTGYGPFCTFIFKETCGVQVKLGTCRNRILQSGALLTGIKEPIQRDNITTNTTIYSSCPYVVYIACYSDSFT